MIYKVKTCVELTTNMDNLIAQHDRKLFAAGDDLLNQAKTLLQSLTGPPSTNDVDIPQVRLERQRDWSLEGAVILQLRRVRVCTCTFTGTSSQLFT